MHEVKRLHVRNNKIHTVLGWISVVILALNLAQYTNIESLHVSENARYFAYYGLNFSMALQTLVSLLLGIILAGKIGNRDLEFATLQVELWQEKKSLYPNDLFHGQLLEVSRRLNNGLKLIYNIAVTCALLSIPVGLITLMLFDSKIMGNMRFAPYITLFFTVTIATNVLYETVCKLVLRYVLKIRRP